MSEFLTQEEIPEEGRKKTRLQPVSRHLEKDHYSSEWGQVQSPFGAKGAKTDRHDCW